MRRGTNKGRGRFIRVSAILSAALVAAAAALAAFVSGYALAFSKIADLWSQTTLLKARASELEAEILRLKNYAVLIDALATQGRASKELFKLGERPETNVENDSSLAAEKNLETGIRR
jgi:hypothetical protein